MMAGKMSSVVGMGTVNFEATKLLLFRIKKQAFVLAFQKTMILVVATFSLALIPLRGLIAPKNTQGPKA